MISRLTKLFFEGFIWDVEMEYFYSEKREPYFIFSVNLFINYFWGPFLKIKLFIRESTV